MTGTGSDRMGWMAATVVTAFLWSVGSLVALNLSPAPGEGIAEQAVLLDMALAEHPSISAVTDFAPDTAEAPPSLTQPEPAAADTPIPPADLAEPAEIAAPEAAEQPKADSPAVVPADLPPLPPTMMAEAPPPAPKPKPTPERKPDPEPAEKPAPAAKPTPAAKPKPTPEPAKTAAAKPSAAGGTPKPKAAKAGGGKGASNPASYGNAVMKKIKSTRKQSAPARGTVVVGFSIAADGGLKSVKVIASSGDGGLDQVAIDHIRRAQPFPAPPEGAQRSYSFEFVGKP